MSKKLALLFSLSVGGIAIFAATALFHKPATALVDLSVHPTFRTDLAAIEAPLSWDSARVAAPSAARTSAVPAEPLTFEKATSLLAAGEFEAAAAEATRVLTFLPYSTEGYQVMVDIARATDDVEAQLRWGKWMAWSFKASDNKKGLEAISAELAAIYPDWNKDAATLGDWRQSMEKAIKSASSKKQYRLAGHLMDKLLELNPSDKKLLKDYSKLAAKAGTELSGGAFVAAAVRRKSPKWLAKNNAKHSNWDTRWMKKSKFYEIETTMDYAFFETLSAAMDQMNEFYRSVYDMKKKSPRARIIVHRKRSDFDRITQKLTGQPITSEGVGGFWLVGAKTVNTFDRSMGDPNQTRADLWATLFHEASHQFMSIIMDKSEKRNYSIPAWLSEGAASYFEGCIIKADGTILKNNIAEPRLRSWWYLEHSDDRKSLKDLVAHERNAGPDIVRHTRSYEGEFYPYGWAFVYFLLNYEEGDLRVSSAITPGQGIPAEHKTVRKAGRLVYRQAYLDYIEFFSKEGNKDNDQFYPWEMAQKFFIDDIKDPDVPNWDAFENRWRTFTNSLYGELLTGPEFADVLQARCRGYLLADDYERARVTAEQADEKRPFDAETYRLLAISNLGEGLKGDSIFWMVRHWESVWQAGNEEETLAAEEWLKLNGGKEVLKLYLEPTKLTLEQVEKDMESALEDGHPILATLFATHAMQAFQLEFTELLTKSTEMAELAGQDLRVWQAAYDKTPESDRKDTTDTGALMEVVKYTSDGLMLFNPEGAASPGYERSDVSNLLHLEPPFSMRGEVQIDGNAVLIPLGIDRSGTATSRVIFVQHDDDGTQEILLQTLAYRVDPSRGSARLMETTLYRDGWESDEPIQFEFNMRLDGTGDFTINDMEPVPLPEDFNKHHFTGGFALLPNDNTAVLFKSFTVRPNKPFWPVTSSQDEE